MSTAPEKRRFSFQMYLAYEEASPTKHEFYRGEIFAMPGAGPRHNRIISNLLARLHGVLDGTDCEVYGSDQRIRIDSADLSTYPDLTIICGELRRHAIDRIAATNPRVVIEVLSSSTEKYNRGKKFELYQQLESLEEYLLVAQEEPAITQLVRNDDGSWRYTLAHGPDSKLELSCLPIQIPLSVIYRNVQFGPEDDA